LSKGGGETGDFLGRWSRRKRAVADEPDPAGAAAPEVGPKVVADPVDDPEETDAEILSELGLPDPDTMKTGDDFSAFMARAVPRRLRERALRRLWVSDPVLANLDGLVDYAGDYTDAATVFADIKTGYKIGRGFLEEVNKIAGKPEPETEVAAPEPAAEQGEAEAGGQAAAADDPVEPEPPARISGHTGPDFTPRGRMRFRLAEE
jgi:hypothetical protein